MTTRESLPPRVLRFQQMAAEARLSEPLGRALALHARLLNAGGSKRTRQLPLERLSKIQDATARRWREHWEAGGHLRVLRNAEEERRMQRERRWARLPEGARLRAVVRYTRRTTTKDDTTP